MSFEWHFSAAKSDEFTKFESQEMQFSFWTTEEAQTAQVSHPLALQHGFLGQVQPFKDSSLGKAMLTLFYTANFVSSSWVVKILVGNNNNQ